MSNNMLNNSIPDKLLIIFYFSDLTMGYQRLSGNTNHNNVDQKPTHLPPSHYAHGHRWNEPYFDLTMPKNITSLVGKSAYLGCRVKHLGNKTVSGDFLISLYLFLQV